jgi:TRAP-type C4-dicarboxylate transport system permease small subunit
MGSLLGIGLRLSRFLYGIAGVTLVFMMLLTVADVILRTFGRPITGTYEMVAFAGAVVIGFALPFTSWIRGHVYMEFLIQRLPKQVRDRMNLFTRLIGIILFVLIAYNLIIVGVDLQKSGEVSPTLRFPFYPIVYGVGICCFIECLVLFCDILKISGGDYE